MVIIYPEGAYIDGFEGGYFGVVVETNEYEEKTRIDVVISREEAKIDENGIADIDIHPNAGFSLSLEDARVLASLLLEEITKVEKAKNEKIVLEKIPDKISQAIQEQMPRIDLEEKRYH